jgi:hypothetical protein
MKRSTSSRLRRRRSSRLQAKVVQEEATKVVALREAERGGWSGEGGEVRTTREYRGDKDDITLLFFNFSVCETTTPCSTFQIFGFSGADLIIGVGCLK